MQGTRVRALIQEDTTATEARVPRARAPQQEKPPQWEARAPQQTAAGTRRNEDPTQPGKKKKRIKLMIHATTQMDLKNIMQAERSQMQKITYWCDVIYFKCPEEANL